MVIESIDIIIVILIILNTKILKAINCGLIRIEITQVFYPNLPRKFPKVQSLNEIF
jgi:hypothetical protein